MLVILMLIQLPTHNVDKERYVQGVGRFDDRLVKWRTDGFFQLRQGWDQSDRNQTWPMPETFPGAGELAWIEADADQLAKVRRQPKTRQVVALVARQHDDAAKQAAVYGLCHVAVVVVKWPGTDHVVFHVDVVGPRLV